MINCVQCDLFEGSDELHAVFFNFVLMLVRLEESEESQIISLFYLLVSHQIG